MIETIQKNEVGNTDFLTGLRAGFKIVADVLRALKTNLTTPLIGNPSVSADNVNCFSNLTNSITDGPSVSAGNTTPQGMAEEAQAAYLAMSPGARLSLTGLVLMGVSTLVTGCGANPEGSQGSIQVMLSDAEDLQYVADILGKQIVVPNPDQILSVIATNGGSEQTNLCTTTLRAIRDAAASTIAEAGTDLSKCFKACELAIENGGCAIEYKVVEP